MPGTAEGLREGIEGTERLREGIRNVSEEALRGAERIQTSSAIQAAGAMDPEERRLAAQRARERLQTDAQGRRRLSATEIEEERHWQALAEGDPILMGRRQVGGPGVEWARQERGISLGEMYPGGIPGAAPAAEGGVEAMGAGASAALIARSVPALLTASGVMLAMGEVKKQFDDLGQATERLTAGPMGEASKGFSAFSSAAEMWVSGRPLAAVAAAQSGALSVLSAASEAARGIPAEISAMGMGGWGAGNAWQMQHGFDILAGPGAAGDFFSQFANRPEMFAARMGMLPGAPNIQKPTDLFRYAMSGQLPETLGPGQQAAMQMALGPMAEPLHSLSYLQELPPSEQNEVLDLLHAQEGRSRLDMAETIKAGIGADSVTQQWREDQQKTVYNLRHQIAWLGSQEKELSGAVGGGAWGIYDYARRHLWEIGAGIGASPIGWMMGGPVIGAGVGWAMSHILPGSNDRTAEDQAAASKARTEESGVYMNSDRIGRSVGRAQADRAVRGVIAGG